MELWPLLYSPLCIGITALSEASPVPGIYDAGTGNGLNPEFCNGSRNVSSMGDQLCEIAVWLIPVNCSKLGYLFLLALDLQ